MSDLLPLYDDVALALEDCRAAIGPAALHGMMTGMAAAGLALPPARLLAVLAGELDAAVDEDTRDLLLAMDRTLRRQLADDDLGFEILLPEDDQPLAVRVAGMAQWCDGFLGGFGAGTGDRKDTDFPEDVQALLLNVAEFTRAEADEGEADEEAERDFMEVVEYLRIAVLTIYTELAMPRTPEHPPLDAPGLH